MFNDTISDVLTRIRNAGMVKHATVYVPLTRLSQQLCQILEKEGYIHSFRRASVIQSANIRPPLIVVPKPTKRDTDNTSADAIAAIDTIAATDAEVTKATPESIATAQAVSTAQAASEEAEVEAEQHLPAFLVPTAVITPGSQPLLSVELKYIGAMRKPCITNLRRISKPGLRIYTRAQDIPKVLDGMGILILSTSQGLMTDREARARRLGGEILCSVW